MIELLSLVRERVEHDFMSVREACLHVAEKFGTSCDAIRRAWLRNAGSLEKSHGNRLLTNVAEAMWVGILLCLATSAAPLNREQLLCLVRTEHGLSPTWDGKHWARGFLGRHADRLSTVIGKSLDSPTDIVYVKSSIQRFIDLWEGRLRCTDFDDDLLINADETPVGQKQSSAGSIVGVA